MQNLPAYTSAPSDVMATEGYVRRTDMVRKKSAAAPAKRARQPAKRTVKRKYAYSRRPNGAIQIEIPECSQHYIKSLYNPWNVPAGVCIPCDLFPLPSQKVMVKKRFSVTLSSNGCGWVVLAPNIASDSPTGAYSTAGSTGGMDSAFNAGASWTTTSIYFDTLPYTEADIVTDKTVQGRVVAIGCRARYVGVEDKRGGTYVSIEEQDHQDLYANSIYNTINKIKSMQNAYITSPRGDGEWDIAVCYSGPTAPHEIDFQSDVNPLGPSVSEATNFLGLFFGGTSDMAGQLVDVEIAYHVEYVGRKVPGKTVSHADTKTYGKVLETVKEAAAIAPIEPSQLSSGFSTFISKVAESAPKLINFAMGAASTIATGNPLPLLASGAQLFMPNQQKNERLMIKG